MWNVLPLCVQIPLRCFLTYMKPGWISEKLPAETSCLQTCWCCWCTVGPCSHWNWRLNFVARQSRFHAGCLYRKHRTLIFAALCCSKSPPVSSEISSFHCPPRFRLPSSLLSTYNAEVISCKLGAGVGFGYMLYYRGGIRSMSSTIYCRICTWTSDDSSSISG